MPRTRNPNQVIEAFDAEVGRLADLWADTNDALLHARGRTASHRDRLAKESCVDAFLRLAVAFESFRSEWHITAIHRDSANFRRGLEDRILGRLDGDERTKPARPYVHVALPRFLSLDRTRGLVDPLGRNVTLKPRGRAKHSWSARAEAELNNTYAAKVWGLAPADWNFMHAVEAIRNHLAHRSEDSVNEMNSALVSLDKTRDDSLRVSGAQMVRADGVPRYLWAYARGRDGPCRLVLYYERVREIAEALRVS